MNSNSAVDLQSQLFKGCTGCVYKHIKNCTEIVGDACGEGEFIWVEVQE